MRDIPFSVFFMIGFCTHDIPAQLLNLRRLNIVHSIHLLTPPRKLPPSPAQPDYQRNKDTTRKLTCSPVVKKETTMAKPYTT
jgi:hypothetical protein